MNEQLSIYNPNFINFNKEKIFFGEGKNSQRYDVLKYPFFDKINKTMMGQDWMDDEINCIPDKQQWITMPLSMQHSVTSVLGKLSLLDSLAGRAFITILGAIVTLPEFEACILTWQHFECNKHSRSYTHILRSVYDNPTEIFDGFFEIKELIKLSKEIAVHYDDCLQKVISYDYKTLNGQKVSDEEMLELKKSIVRMFLEINILEGIRFYSGFSTIWAMHYSQGYMEKTGKILQLICRDENLHLAITQHLLKILRDNADEGFQEAYAFWQPQIREIYRNAAEQEFEWIDYIFKEGGFMGMNADIAKSYIKFLTNKRLKAIGENIVFEGFTKNPIPWSESYINNDGVERLLQEGEQISYKMDILNQFITDEQLKHLNKMLD